MAKIYKDNSRDVVYVSYATGARSLTIGLVNDTLIIAKAGAGLRQLIQDRYIEDD
jgi:hypothetical protein